MDEEVDIQHQFDHYCRALEQVIELVPGPAVVRLEFPMIHMQYGEEVDVEVRAWRCPDHGIHVQAEISRLETYTWNKEHSDEVLYGPNAEEPA